VDFVLQVLFVLWISCQNSFFFVCGDTLVDVGAWLVLVFVHVAYPNVPAEERKRVISSPEGPYWLW
jgi:hypothetical protein